MQRFTFSLANSVGVYRQLYHSAKPLLVGLDASAALVDSALRQQLALHGCPPSTVQAVAPSLLGISELVALITDTHHVYLFAELGRLEVLFAWLGEKELTLQFETWANDLRIHMEQEENELFPLCLALDQAHNHTCDQKHCPDPNQALHGMYRGHESVESELILITAHVATKIGDERLLAALRHGLADMLTDLRLHLELEDSVLLPAVIFASDLRASRSSRTQHTCKANELIPPERLTPV